MLPARANPVVFVAEGHESGWSSMMITLVLELPLAVNISCPCCVGLKQNLPTNQTAGEDTTILALSSAKVLAIDGPASEKKPKTAAAKNGEICISDFKAKRMSIGEFSLGGALPLPASLCCIGEREEGEGHVVMDVMMMVGRSRGHQT